MSEAGPAARVAIVTGAARGIGAATALRLAEDGFAVAVLDLDEAAGQGHRRGDRVRRGPGARRRAPTSATPTQVEAAVERIVAELGPPTVLVNNAGVTRDNMLFKMTDADWDTVMNVHLRGAFLMTRAAQKHMIEAKWGRIVNLSSVSALGNRGQANYSTAKAGLQGFTKTLAIELGKFGVTANAIAPGLHPDRDDQGDRRAHGHPVRGLHRGRRQGDPGGRVGQPEDIAHLVSFLVSEGAGFVSGQVIYAAGGPQGLSSVAPPRGPGSHLAARAPRPFAPEEEPVSDEVLVERRGAVQVITINRPQARNALDAAVARGVADAVDELDASDDLRAGVLTGAGGFFSAGMDLKAFLRGETPAIEGRGLCGITITPPRKPLVAAVEGWALAGGFELVLACDLVVAGRTARFGVPEVKRSLVAAGGRGAPAAAAGAARASRWSCC